MKNLRLILIIFSIFVFLYGVYQLNDSVDLFTTETTPEEGLLTDQPYKSSNWFSSLYSFPSEPVFALPGVYQVTQEGLILSQPNQTASADTVFGSFIRDCVINFGSPVTSTEVIRYGDWNVVFDIITAQASSRVTMTKGSPFIYIEDAASQLEISCSEEGYSKFLFQSQSTDSSSSLDHPLTLTDPAGSYRVGVVPVGEANSREILTQAVWNPVLDTQVLWNQTSSGIQTNYHFITTTNQPILTTLWPHQVAFLQNKHQILGRYQTAQGELLLVRLKTFSTLVPVPKLPMSFTASNDSEIRSTILDLIEDDLARISEATFPEGTYFRGTELGALTSLIQLADAYNYPAQTQTAVALLEQRLVPDLSTHFSYDQDLQMYVAQNPEFGSEEGNDHHFHYGYYIRAAAVLVHYKPELRSELEPVISAMIQDIATVDRKASDYPRLRHFSVYDGHSWADGNADFADGNNQESTSEALNAWYALKLWGQETQDESLQELGVWLFSQELVGTQTYWFGMNNPFPQAYKHEMASIVWGGKRDFGTWFSGEPLHVYGIQWLPITPASTYLADLPNRELQFQEIQRLDLAYLSHEWADLYLAYLAYSDSETARKLYPQVDTFAGIKLKSLLFHSTH